MSGPAFLLDTSTFLWWVTNDEALSDEAVNAITEPSSSVFLSAVSSWEISLKHGIGKLPLPEAPSSLIPRLRDEHGIAVLPLQESAALLLPKLPRLHRDPFDRMLVCQAIDQGLTLVTPDAMIRSYPVSSIW